MRFRTICTLALALGAATASNALAGVGINISIGDAPPPPVIVVRHEPRMMFVPEARVYVVSDDRPDYDWFRVGTSWYIERDGWWYRANSYRGPYRVIEERYVPAVVWRVPDKHWRHPHGGPPGQMKKAYGGGKSKGHGRR